MRQAANRKERRARGKGSPGGATGSPATAARVQAGLQRQMAGDLPGAVAIYNEILAVDPHQPDALHLLGVACLQTGRLADAVALIRRAIGANPKVADYHGNLAAALLRLERDDEAEEAAGRAIELDPGNAGFHGNLAVAQRRLGKPLDAAAAFEKALALNPTAARLHKEIGDLHAQAQSYERATEHYRAYLALVPDDPEIHLVWNNLGYALEKRGEFGDAESLYRRAMAARPDDPDYVNNVGLVCGVRGDFEESEILLRRAVAMAPGTLKFVTNLSGLLLGLGRIGEAEAMVKAEAALHEGDALFWLALGNVYKTAGYPEQARDIYLKAIKLDPANVEAHQELATSYVNTNQMQLAYDTYRKVLELNPTYVQAHLLMCEALQNLKRPDEANVRAHALMLLPDYLPGNLGYPMKAFRYTCDFDGIDSLGDVLDILDRIPPKMLPMSFLHLLVLADTPERTRKIVELHRRWGEWLVRRAETNPLPPLPARQPAGKIRIGFLSSDLNRHSVAACLMPFLEDFDRDRFEVFCYSPKNVADDPVQEKIVGLVDGFRFLVNRPDREFAEAIRGDDVDILFELNGITQNSRTPVTAYRPAPVQVSYLGYPFTFGVPTIDYMLLDRFLEPEQDDLLVETPLIMDGSWIGFGNMGDCDPNPVPPSDTNGYVTFGTLNNPYKFTREAVALWAEVMRQVPDSRFLMVRWTDSSTMRCHHLMTEFARNGIAEDRLYFMRNDVGQHLPCYHQIDLSLDTFPLTGGNTTVDALWMGVPVVSLRGPSYHQRISHAILNHAGLGDFSCPTREAFLETAVALANDVERRRQLRPALRGQLLQSDMFRRDRFVPAFEETMLRLVEKHGLR